MRYFYLGCGIIMMLLAGCTQANTVGQETNKELDNKFTNNGGTFIVYSPVTVYASNANESGQTTDNDPAQSINPATSLGMEGGTSSLAAEGADMALRGISSLMDNKKVPKATPAPATVEAKESAIPAVPDNKTSSVTAKEYGEYYGRHNGDRPHWYFSKPMKDYPDNFTVVIDGCENISVTGNNGERFDPGTGDLVKQSDVAGREMVVLARSTCKSESAYIEGSDKVTEVLPLKESGDRSYTWLDHEGSFYAGPVKFTFDNSCGILDVEDAAVSQGEDSKGKDGMYYFSGADFNEGDIEYNDGRASVFTGHGCIASEVKIEYTAGG